MKTPLQAVLTVALLLAAPTGGTVERVEILLDMSADMWDELGGGPPRFIPVREALTDFAAASVQRQGRPEVSLRLVGGGRVLTDGDWCEDTRLLVPFEVMDPTSFRNALADLVPSGGRPLVRGLEQAIADLDTYEERRRIVIITAGSDQCHEDVIESIEKVISANPPIDLRIIGLGLHQTVANAATLLAPTRNIFDFRKMTETLEWALQPADTRPIVANQFELILTLGGTPVTSAEIELTDATGGERAYATVESGRAEVRLKAGRYRANLIFEDQSTVELGGLVVGHTTETLRLDLFDIPPVTLETDPEQPLAGGVVHVAAWGAPTGETWIALALPDSAIDQYLVRARFREEIGEVAFDLPDIATSLEARFINEVQPGVFRLLGKHSFRSVQPRVRLECPESIENGSPLGLSWTGPGHSGGHITVAPKGSDSFDYSTCLLAPTEIGTLTTTAPFVAGDYVVFYLSKLGQILDRRSLEVFEVLATLDGPGQADTAANVMIVWTGPDAPQDFLSLAHPGSTKEAYISWAPTAEGNPARLQVPQDPGLYEIRYIRSADGAILARHALEVKDPEFELKFKQPVAAGTRFDVHWKGTARSGDFLAVAEVGSSALDSLDFSYAAAGSPLSLAAPFEPGRYEVRYISGSDRTILAAEPLNVR